ncbi:MAG: hypothetical protein HPY90_12615 [Syntrophothermus sp.]|uniref:hypothetical protein n=1 Tax=Syntrophothermus sp. TaxID=2736299 RepID=UPI00258089E7|nr:hypothetical protein [Syntrophothermus sp.]NSW84092.1 hypothetical protein [Syntrophothermus sp.]
MAAQHKRPGRKAKEERIARARDREVKKQTKVVIGYPHRGQARNDIGPGRLVIWAEVVEIAKGKNKEKRTYPAAPGTGSGREGYARAAESSTR